MTPEKQRAAIAEACGIVTHDQWGPLYKTPQGLVRVCPDYLNDLNAMHEAEKVLKDVTDYSMWIARIVKTNLDEYPNLRDYWPLTHATAAQRASAFLRTIGKWKDAK